MAGKREDLEIVIGANLDGLAADLRKGAGMAKGFAREVAAAAPKAPEFAIRMDTSGIRAAARAAREADGGFRSAASGLAGFAGKAAVASGVFMALEAGVAGVTDVVRHLKESVSMAAELEQTTLAFDVMLGSAERAKEMVAGLRRLAAETPFASNEVIGAGKQLLAYGVAADQVIPKLRMLGDASAAHGKDLPLKELTYLYGTLYSQQRAFAVDLKQFAGRGIPIYEELAKSMQKPVHEIKEIGEEGRIMRDDITKAFIQMTSEGGRFYNMTKRQAETLSGSWEQMTDAFDLAKIKLGQIIIEETGLKGIVRDLEKFANGIEGGIDTKGLRDGIRFTSDLVKGVAQVGYEFAKAGLQSANIFGDMASQLPMLRGPLESINAIVQGMKSFKLDPAMVAEAAIATSKTFLANGAIVVGLVTQLGESFSEHILDPIITALREMRSVMHTAAAYKGAAIATLEAVSPVNTLRRFGEMKGWVDRVEPGLQRQPGDLPNDPGKTAMLEVLKIMKGFGATMKETADILDASGQRIRASFELKREAEREAVNRAFKFSEDNAKIRANLLLAQTAVGGGAGFRQFLNPIDPMAGIVAGSITSRNDFEPSNWLAGIVTRGRDWMQPPGVRTQGDLGAGAVDLVRALKEKYDPLAEGGKFMRDKSDLDELLKRGLIGPDLFALGYRDMVTGLADRLGTGGAPKLADAALVGSQEDARLLSNFLSGNQQATTEDLLKRIEDHLRDIRQTNGRMERVVPRVADFGGPFGDF